MAMAYNNNINMDFKTMIFTELFPCIPSTSSGQPSSSNCISPMNEFHQDDSDKNKSSLNQFRLDEKFTDIDIIINKKKFSCHRVILAWKSSYFEEMFRKNPSNVIDGDPTLMKIGAELFENILSFMYENSANCITKENAFRMYKFSEKLYIKELQKKSAQFIKNSSLKVDHQVDACKLAIEWKDMSLVDAICKRLGKQVHFDELMQKRYADLPYDVFYKIIKNTEIKDENKKADAIVKWVNVNTQPLPLRLQLLKLVNRDKVDNYGKLKKLIRDADGQSARPTQNEVSKNAKRSKSDNIIEGVTPIKIAKKSIDSPINCSLFDTISNRLKVFAETFTSDGNHSINVFSFEDDQWKWLPNEKVNVICNGLKSVRWKDCNYFVAFQNGSNNSRSKNLFWMVDAIGQKKNLTCFSEIVEDYRLTVLNGELILYDVNCAVNNRSLRRYEVTSDMWYYIKTPMVLHDAGVAECNGLYYVCGGTTGDGNSNKKAYCYDHRLPTWIDIPEMIHNHDRAVACSHDDDIYVYGSKKGEFEMFDATGWKWRSLRAKECADVPFFYESEKFLVSNDDNVLLMNADGRVTKYCLDSDTWSPIRSFPTTKFSQEMRRVVLKDVVEEWR